MPLVIRSRHASVSGYWPFDDGDNFRAAYLERTIRRDSGCARYFRYGAATNMLRRLPEAGNTRESAHPAEKRHRPPDRDWARADGRRRETIAGSKNMETENARQ